MKAKAAPMVAIITRTDNRNLFLKRAIESVEKQTYTDYLHVIFNNGGDKKSLDTLIAKYKNPKRVVVHSDERIGCSKALNTAIRKTESRYVTILDDDDTWHPERLEKTIPYLETTGEAAVAIKMDIVIEEMHGSQIVKISQNLHPQSGEGEINLYKQCQKNYLSNGIITYRREVFDELKGYDETLPVAEDWDFGIRLMLKHDVAFLRKEEPLFFYHQRPDQTGVNGNSVHARVEEQEKTINVIRNRYLRNDLNRHSLGIGYIMNKLEQDEVTATRLEGHVNYALAQSEERIIQKLNKNLSEIVNRLTGVQVYRKARRLLKRG